MPRNLRVWPKKTLGRDHRGWRLTLTSARTFVMGDVELGIAPKYVGNASLVERSLVTLATTRGLMLVGEPGTAKSLLSELIAAAVSGDSTLTIQGGAATTEDQIRYSWNYALLVAEGPSTRSMVPAPMMRGMAEGRVVRFEEVTRCPLEVQDTLLSLLSERVLAVPELSGDDAMVYAREGFNVIATANTRDRGVNEMSAALKRRFNFETVHPIADFDTEVELVRTESAALLRASGVAAEQDPAVSELLVTLFRDLRTGFTANGSPVERLSSVMSTAEAGVPCACHRYSWVVLARRRRYRHRPRRVPWPVRRRKTTVRMLPGCAATSRK